METSTNIESESSLIPLQRAKSPIPSQVRNRQFLYPSSRRSDVDKLESGTFGGQWLVIGRLLHPEVPDEEGMTELDRLWVALKQEFLDNISSTTTVQSPFSLKDGKDIVYIHTRDYRDKEEVRMVAEKIRDVVGDWYKEKLFYKTYDAKRGNMYSAFECIDISKYMQEYNGSFSEKIDGEWRLIYNPAQRKLNTCTKSSLVDSGLPQVLNLSARYCPFCMNVLSNYHKLTNCPYEACGLILPRKKPELPKFHSWCKACGCQYVVENWLCCIVCGCRTVLGQEIGTMDQKNLRLKRAMDQKHNCKVKKLIKEKTLIVEGKTTSEEMSAQQSDHDNEVLLQVSVKKEN